MRPILSEIYTFSQHLQTLEEQPELYRPPQCLYCSGTTIWSHGFYYRKPDRIHHGKSCMNDIPIPRFQCAACKRTFSTLPEGVAPHRWYPWVIQQWCLWLSLQGWSVNQLSQHFPMVRSTISRWCHWLSDKFKHHYQVSCERDWSMGYFADVSSFWNRWLEQKPFSTAMLLLNQQGVSVP
jgi:transposase-like protein